MKQKKGGKKCEVFQPGCGSKVQNGNAKVIVLNTMLRLLAEFQLSPNYKFTLSYSALKQKHLVDGFYINSAVNLKVQHPGRPEATTYRRFDLITSPKRLISQNILELNQFW